MGFRVTITDEAGAQFRELTAREQGTLKEAIATKLVDRPTIETKAVKRLRPNPLAEFELRVGDLRVLYNVEGSEVLLLIVGRKAGNALIVGGQRFHGYEADPAEPTGGGPPGHPG